MSSDKPAPPSEAPARPAPDASRGDMFEPRTPEALWPAHYEELHAVAVSALRGEPRSPSLQPTLVLLAAYMKVFGGGAPEWRGSRESGQVSKRIESAALTYLGPRGFTPSEADESERERAPEAKLQQPASRERSNHGCPMSRGVNEVNTESHRTLDIFVFRGITTDARISD